MLLEVQTPAEYEAAMAAAKPGDEIVLDPAGGPYPRFQETTKKNDITIRSALGERAVIGGLYANGNGWHVEGLDVHRDTGGNPNAWGIRLGGDRHMVSGVKVDYTNGGSGAEYRAWGDAEWRAKAGNGIRLDGDYCAVERSAIVGTHIGIRFGFGCMGCVADSNLIAGYTESAIRPRGMVRVANNLASGARRYAKTHGTAISTRLREPLTRGRHLPLTILNNTVISSLIYGDPGTDASSGGFSQWAYLTDSQIERNIYIGPDWKGWFLYQVSGSVIRDNWCVFDYGVPSPDDPTAPYATSTMWRYQPDPDGEPNIFEGNVANRFVATWKDNSTLVTPEELAAAGNRVVPVGDYSALFPHWRDRKINAARAFLPGNPAMGSDLAGPWLLRGQWPWEAGRNVLEETAANKKEPPPVRDMAAILDDLEALIAEARGRL